MRMAYLINTYPMISQTFIMREIHRLRELGCEVETLSIEGPDRPFEELTAEERLEAAAAKVMAQSGIAGALIAHFATLVTMPWRWMRGLLFALSLAGTDVGRVFELLSRFSQALQAGRWMRRRGLTHLHVADGASEASAAMIASKIFPITFSFSARGAEEFFDAAGKNLTEAIEHAAFVTCADHYTRSQLMMMTPPVEWEKFEIALPGVSLEAFKPVAKPVVADAFEILSVGDLIPARGQHALIAAVDRLVNQEGRNLRLRLVGEGPDRSLLEAQIDGAGLWANVLFEGALDHERIRSFYANADAFVLPSFAEGAPIGLLEAMAMEIPCISTHIPGIPELIRDGMDGLLTAPSDVVELADAIAELMDNQILRVELAAAGRERVLRRHNIEQTLPRLMAIFQERIGDQPVREGRDEAAEGMSMAIAPAARASFSQ
ncbi:MAG: glycosyltransferase family 4 protein [Blastocatellia bacterium]|nr:glycosyltransferase family 4 protein [Blastocatellia bacterium]